MAFASLVETSTLAALVFIAVPLKHYAHLPVAVSWIGPVHGLAFIFYVWLLSTKAHDPIWTRRDIVRLCISAVIPLSGFFNIGLFRRRKTTLLSGTAR
nr:DUF3817 domain-containing protein [Pseudomonas petrae]